MSQPWVAASPVEQFDRGEREHDPVVLAKQRDSHQQPHRRPQRRVPPRSAAQPGTRRAVVTEPPLLLLDEPLSNLDAKLRESLRFELKRLQWEIGVTSVSVTHDQVEASRPSLRPAGAPTDA